MPVSIDVASLDAVGKFLVLDDPVTHDAFLNVFIVRLRFPENLPAGAVDAGNQECLIAYSRLCTHLGCQVANMPPGTTVNAFSPLAGHATFDGVVVCPCHFTNFDLLRSGLVVIGPATDCLPQVELQRVDTTHVRLNRWMRQRDVPYGVPFAGTSASPPES